jgi:hypothetical protein
MELLTQANLLIAIAGPIVLIVAINALLQRGNERRPLFEKPAPRIPVPAPVAAEPAVASFEAANDAQHERAA